MGGPPMGGSGGGPSKPVNIFGIIMGLRKIVSVCAILTVIGLEASTAIQ